MSQEIKVYNKQIHSLNINNSGTLNESNLQFAKRTILFDSLRAWSNELVKHNQGYPENDISDVELTVDFVILTPKRYKQLLALENQLDSKKVTEPKIRP